MFKRDESVVRRVKENPGLPVPHLKMPVAAARDMIAGRTHPQKHAADVPF